MRSSLQLVGVGVLTWLCGCSRPESAPVPPTAPLSFSVGKTVLVHLQNGFRDDPIQVFVDGQLAYGGRPKTEEVLGFTGVGFAFTSGKDTAVAIVRSQLKV
jgi:hypothetical protein